MKINRSLKSLVSAVLVASIALQPLAARAALHPMSFIKAESATLETLDMVANTDWDYDVNPPLKSPNGQTLDRAYISAVFAQVARSMFTMTEGRHRLGSVFVYATNRFGNEVDTKLIGATRGRSNGSVSGWARRGGTTNNYLEGDPASLGKVIAHENGHYVYGLMDEYREEGKPLNPNDVSDPSEVDTPLNTIMNNQEEFPSLSTAADNVAPTNTAQKRWFGASAWEVLARPASADPVATQRLNRTAFAAFAGFAPASAAALTKPTAGWDAAFKVVFVSSPVDSNTYVISRSVRADQLPAVKNAVVESLRKIVLSSKAAVNVVTYGGNNGVPQAIFRAFIDTEAARNNAIAAVEAITVDPAAGSLEVTLGSILDLVNQQYAGQLLSLGDNVTLNVFAGGEDNISVATRDRAKALRVAVNSNIITDDGIQPGSSAKRAVAYEDLAKKAMRAKVTQGTVTLAQLAHATGGHYVDAHKPAALVAGAAKGQAATGGAMDVTLSSDFVESLAVGAKFELKTPVLGKTDGTVNFNVYWATDADSASIRYELTAPDGTKFTPVNPLVNQSFGAGGQVKYVMEADTANASFEVDAAFAGKNGVWTSTVSSTRAMSSEVAQDVGSYSTLRADIDVLKDGTPDPTLVVTLSTSRAVQGAVATAYFYGADGKLKLTKALLDDGKRGDFKPNDGVYSVSLGGALAAGQYDVVVTMTQGPNGAVLSTTGATIKGVNAPSEPLGGAFSRVAETMLTIAPATVVEYFVPSLKKYFITGRESDKFALGQYPAVYSLTGMSFLAGPGLNPPVGTQPICRFYFAPPLANTHFYGVPSDCTLVATTFAGNNSVTNEGIDFAVATPDAGGNCPASAPVKVYRSFNNRSAQNDGNHRYTVSQARYNQMIAQGYSAEGAVFCAVSATDAAQ